MSATSAKPNFHCDRSQATSIPSNNEAYALQINMLGMDQALKGMEGSLKALEDNIGFLGIQVKALKNDTKAVAGNIGASVGTGPGLGNVANGPFPGVGSAP